MNLVLVSFFILFPLVISFYTQRVNLLNKIGPVLLCYLTGLIIGHSGIIYGDFYEILEGITNFSILLALPILLFDANPRKWKTIAGPSLKSMIIAILALIIVVIAGHFIFGTRLSEDWKLAGMMIGVYTGGTPNLASIKTALDVSNDVYIGVHTVDTVLGAIYLLFLMTAGKSWFRKTLGHDTPNQLKLTQQNRKLGFSMWVKSVNYKTLGLALLISLLIAGSSAGIGLMLDEKYQMTVIILLITTLGILVSMLRPAEKLKSAFPLGMYLINVFSLSVAAQANIYEITQLGFTLILYVAFVMFSTFILHFLVAKIFKVDADTMMITSTALICSPPFVPVIAGSLKNKNLILPGLTVGIIGYAIGNYLGILIANLIK